ncbi:MAG: hypothetical protein EOO61_02655 [Hymenobacter sp.]|nr:MAG: hypothetical protein EOO61_02655 [Hymenobacter sp.]
MEVALKLVRRAVAQGGVAPVEIEVDVKTVSYLQKRCSSVRLAKAFFKMSSSADFNWTRS